MKQHPVHTETFLRSFQQGRWDPAIVGHALDHARRLESPAAWINYADICHTLQSMTLEQWLEIAQCYDRLSYRSPKLLLRLWYLILTPGIIESISEADRSGYCNTLQPLTRTHRLMLISDVLTTGYLGSRLQHYPRLALGIEKNIHAAHTHIITHQEAKKTLDHSAVATFTELVKQLSCDTKRSCSPLNIAVVGNSPVIAQEIRGDEIDSADIVIRFNNCALSQSNRHHCGNRTDLWIMSPSTPISYCPQDTRAICVSGLHALTRPSFYWKKVLYSDKLLGEFSASVWYALVRQFQAPPSAGALLLASLDSLNAPINVRTYGFTTNQHQLRALANHHADNKPRSTRHNWQAETDWLADRRA